MAEVALPFRRNDSPHEFPELGTVQRMSLRCKIDQNMQAGQVQQIQQPPSASKQDPNSSR
jgi:hypothetical protein